MKYLNSIYYFETSSSGQEALEKAVKMIFRIIGIVIPKVYQNLYQQQGQKEKAINLLEDMYQRFPERNPCSIWSICIIKQKIIRMSFIRLTGLSKSLVRMNSSAWRSSTLSQMEDDKKSFSRNRRSCGGISMDIRYLTFIG